MRDNPQSPLVSEFRRGYTEDLAKGEERTMDIDPEVTLEKIEAFHRMGWKSNVEEMVHRFERETGIDFEELAQKSRMDVEY